MSLSEIMSAALAQITLYQRRPISLGNLGESALQRASRVQGFQAADADKDGAVSAAEFSALGKNGGAESARAGALFAALDSDRSGGLSWGELGHSALLSPQGLTAMLSVQEDALAAWTLSRADADASGGLSAQEYAATVSPDGAHDGAADFARLDADGDGSLSAAEMAGDDSRRLYLVPVKLGVQPDRVGAGLGAVMALMDEDGDGSLSTRELAGGRVGALDPTRLINLADADGDGQLTRTELQAAIDRRPQDYARGVFRIGDATPEELELSRLLMRSPYELSRRLIAPVGVGLDASA